MLSGMTVILFWLAGPALGASGGERAPRFELKPGDRIVFLGSGLIEQERRHGYLESRLSRRHGARHRSDRRLSESGGVRPLVEGSAGLETDGDLHWLRHERIVR